MVVIVPAFAIGEDGDPPEVAGGVAGVVVAVSPEVSGGVYEPGAVVGSDHPDAHSPDEP